MIKYQGYSALVSYLRSQAKWSFRGFLVLYHEVIVSSSSSKDWRELNKTWVDRFLGAAKKLSDKKIFADLAEREFKKRKQENKENVVPYPSIRSWATNGIISPDQRDKYYYADPAKTNTELLNSILEGKFVALHGPRSSDTIESGSDFAVAFNEWKSVVIFIDEFDRLYGAIDKVLIIVGTFGILVLNSSNNYDSPFNVRDPFQNPNLSKEQVQRLFKEFGLEHKLNVESEVIEDIYLQTNGHASMVCLCGNLIEKIKLPDNDDNFSFASWKNLLFTSLNKNIYGILIVVEDQINTFMVASPLIRSVILRYVLPDIFKFCPSTEVPKRTDHSIDMLIALSDAVRVFDKENIELAALHSYKTAQVPVGGCSNVLVPRESVYQQQLAATFTNWISSIGFEVMSQYHMTKRNKHSYSDLVITAPSSWPGKPTVILELLATSTSKKELDEHFERTLKYSQLLKRSLCIRDIWTVHFTCEDEPNHHWPTKEQRKKGLNAIMLWHNRNFTSVYMSACYNDENGNMIEITKENIM
ncbi:hypothetical protein C1646_773377 [Rhizophagus diaphanus]|nr:hypothetical protein C1646_773377 [Rhizophagus diaphanus] [Rhizophagus sp. MUCL 43196]